MGDKQCCVSFVCEKDSLSFLESDLSCYMVLAEGRGQQWPHRFLLYTSLTTSFPDAKVAKTGELVVPLDSVHRKPYGRSCGLIYKSYPQS